jgi:hypothetical protein
VFARKTWEFFGNFWEFWEFLGTFGNCWEFLGTIGNFGNFWELWELLGTFGAFWERSQIWDSGTHIFQVSFPFCQLMGTLPPPEEIKHDSNRLISSNNITEVTVFNMLQNYHWDYTEDYTLLSVFVANFAEGQETN